MNKQQHKQLKSQAHHLKPVIITGSKGMTEAVHGEIELALQAHELIKLRLNAADQAERDQLIVEIVARHQAELIQKMGHTITIYRQRQD